MPTMSVLTTFAVLLLSASPSLVSARTDLEGCTSYASVIVPSSGGAYVSNVWYVPDTGELCDLLDCGGGRAPPKTNVPGCDNYEGTATYEPSYIDVASLLGETVATTTTTGGGVSTTAETAAETTIETTFDTTAGTAATTTTTTRTPITEFITESPTSETASETESTSGAATTPAGNDDSGAMATAAAMLGPCLAAGVAIGLGML